MRFLYYLPTARVAVDTAVVLVGTFVALVSVARFLRYGRRSDLVVAAAMVLLAGAGPLFGGVASLFAPYEGPRLAPEVVRLLAVVALAGRGVRGDQISLGCPGCAGAGG